MKEKKFEVSHQTSNKSTNQQINKSKNTKWLAD
jgi:hypothetical protein